MYVGVHICVGVLGSVFSVHLYLFVCSVACYSISESFGEIRTVAGDPDLIWIRARCGPDTMVIRKPIYGMIHRSVPVRALKIRRQFGFESPVAGFGSHQMGPKHYSMQPTHIYKNKYTLNTHTCIQTHTRILYTPTPIWVYTYILTDNHAYTHELTHTKHTIYTHWQYTNIYNYPTYPLM